MSYDLMTMIPSEASWQAACIQYRSCGDYYSSNWGISHLINDLSSCSVASGMPDRRQHRSPDLPGWAIGACSAASAAAAAVITHPLDVVKTRLQVQGAVPAAASSSSRRAMGSSASLQIARDLLATEGDPHPAPLPPALSQAFPSISKKWQRCCNSLAKHDQTVNWDLQNKKAHDQAHQPLAVANTYHQPPPNSTKPSAFEYAVHCS